MLGVQLRIGTFTVGIVNYLHPIAHMGVKPKTGLSRKPGHSSLMTSPADPLPASCLSKPKTRPVQVRQIALHSGTFDVMAVVDVVKGCD